MRKSGSKGIVALDYGRRRVGVAYAAPDVAIAFGWTTLTIRGARDLWEQLQRLLGERSADQVVIGLPVTLGDRPGALCAEILRLSERLEEAGYQVLLVDEALSSRRAADLQRQQGGRRPRAALDRTAAALLLQEYLDGLLPEFSQPEIAGLRKKITSVNRS